MIHQQTQSRSRDVSCLSITLAVGGALELIHHRRLLCQRDSQFRPPSLLWIWWEIDSSVVGILNDAAEDDLPVTMAIFGEPYSGRGGGKILVDRNVDCSLRDVRDNSPNLKRDVATQHLDSNFTKTAVQSWPPTFFIDRPVSRSRYRPAVPMTWPRLAVGRSASHFEAVSGSASSAIIEPPTLEIRSQPAASGRFHACASRRLCAAEWRFRLAPAASPPSARGSSARAWHARRVRRCS